MSVEVLSEGSAAQAVEKPCAFQLPPEGIVWKTVERDLVRQALDRAGGNQTIAARLLGIRRDALRRRLIKHGLLEPHPASVSVDLAEAA